MKGLPDEFFLFTLELFDLVSKLKILCLEVGVFLGFFNSGTCCRGLSKLLLDLGIEL
jgi:hypothetical protein